MMVFNELSENEVVIHDGKKPERVFERMSAESDSVKLRARLAFWKKKRGADVRVQRGLKESFQRALVRAEPFMPDLELIFRRYKIPQELTKLVYLESSFNPYALSYAGARGAWQIMPAVGRKLMTVRGSIDERDDPIKGAHGAAKLLRENHLLIKNWPLAVTAYNQGVPALRKLKQSLPSKPTPLQIYQKISSHQTRTYRFAGQNYYWEFLAVLYGEKYRHSLVAAPPVIANTSWKNKRSLAYQDSRP